MSAPRFGLGVPTATEGLIYPVPFADIDEAVELAVTAERLGFDSVWGNEHVSTQRYVRSEYDEPPRFYDPLTYLAYVARLKDVETTAARLDDVPVIEPTLAALQAQLRDG